MKSFGIANYRSFDDGGVFVESPTKFNVIIGKNNCGKSNILKFLHSLAFLTRRRRSGQQDQFDPIIDYHSTSPPELVWSWSLEGLVSSGLQAELTRAGISELRVKALVVSPEKRYSMVTDLKVLPPAVIARCCKEMSRTAWPVLPDNTAMIAELASHLGSRSVEAFRQHYLERVIYVPDVRRLHEDTSGTKDTTILDGRNVVAMLHEMQHPLPGQEEKQRHFRDIETYIRQLLGNDDLQMEVDHNKSTIIIAMNGRRLPLMSFGMGIHELVIMCSAFAIYSNHTVCIEEPELHLHPQLQRSFIKFLRQKTNNTYFISTHSNVFLDIDDDVAIYHVHHDGKSSRMSRVRTPGKVRSVLSDLGYKASDLLQANAIVWVEGPSDRVYIKKWISLAAPDLIEGVHYSLLFYGGSNLAHLAVEDDSADGDFVQLLSINRHCFVVIDRDGDAPSQALAARKSRIIDQIGDDGYWLTAGREVENYLSSRCVLAFLRTKTKEDIAFQCDQNDQIQEAIDAASPGSRSLIDYANHKPERARDFVELMTADDMDVLDLKARIDALVDKIRRWNYEAVQES